jgi:hypothetical protein
MCGHLALVCSPSAAHKLMTTNSTTLAWKRHSYDARGVLKVTNIGRLEV